MNDSANVTHRVRAARNQRQRERRQSLRRIDYADVSREAGGIIDACAAHWGSMNGDMSYSEVLNFIVTDWREMRESGQLPE